jgi:hypothetical protein
MKLLSNRLYTPRSYKTPCFFFLVRQSRPPLPAISAAGELALLLAPVTNPRP